MLLGRELQVMIFFLIIIIVVVYLKTLVSAVWLSGKRSLGPAGWSFLTPHNPRGHCMYGLQKTLCHLVLHDCASGVACAQFPPSIFMVFAEMSALARLLASVIRLFPPPPHRSAPLASESSLALSLLAVGMLCSMPYCC